MAYERSVSQTELLHIVQGRAKLIPKLALPAEFNNNSYLEGVRRFVTEHGKLLSDVLALCAKDSEDSVELERLRTNNTELATFFGDLLHEKRTLLVGYNPTATLLEKKAAYRDASYVLKATMQIVDRLYGAATPYQQTAVLFGCTHDLRTNPVILDQLRDAERELNIGTILDFQGKLDAAVARYQETQRRNVENGEALFHAGVGR